MLAPMLNTSKLHETLMNRSVGVNKDTCRARLRGALKLTLCGSLEAECGHWRERVSVA
jgi:hypothetical protein